MAPFLCNQWYTAATSTELGAKPLARTICNEPLVIFRARDGAVAALTERITAAVKEMHSYTTPAILVIPIESVDNRYLAWLMAETEPAAKGS